MKTVKIRRNLAKVDFEILKGERFVVSDIELLSEGEPLDLSGEDSWQMTIRPAYGKNIHLGSENFTFSDGLLNIAFPKETFSGSAWQVADYDVQSITAGEPATWFGGQIFLIEEVTK